MINLKKIENSAKFKNPSPLTKEEKEKIKKKEEQAKREAKEEEKKEKELQFILAQMKLDKVISNIKDKNSREYTDSDFPLKIDFSIPLKDIKRLKIDKDFRLLQVDENFYIYPKVIENIFLIYLKNVITVFTNEESKSDWDSALRNFFSNLKEILEFFFIYAFSWIGIALFFYCYSNIRGNGLERTISLVIIGVFSLFILGFLLLIESQTFQYHSNKKKSKILLSFKHILNSLFYPITMILLFVKNCITLRNCNKEIQKEKENRVLQLKESPFYFDELIGAQKYTVII